MPHYDLGPLNKQHPTYQLEELVKLILTDPELEFTRIEDKGKLATLAFYNKKTDEGFDLQELLTHFDAEHICLDDSLLAICNEYLNQPERKLKAKQTFLNIFPFDLTDEKIRNSKLNEDIHDLSLAEIKALNIFTQENGYWLIKKILTASFSSLSNQDNAAIIEYFILSMTLLAAINKPLSNGKAKIYDTFRGETDPIFIDVAKDTDALYYRSNKVTSTTTDRSVTDQYVSYDPKKLKVRIEFVNTRAKDISEISYYNKEQETVLCNFAFSYKKKHCYFSDLSFFAKPISSPSLERDLKNNSKVPLR